MPDPRPPRRTARPRGRRHGRIPGAAILAILPLLFAPGSVRPARAAEATRTLELEAIFMQVHGHDPHVLTIHERDLDATPTTDAKTAVSLETDDGLAYRLRYRHGRGAWGWGVDYFLLLTSQDTAERTGAADGAPGPTEEVIFEVADRSFTSSDPGEVLFYRILEDTDLEVWTLDLYGVRRLAGDSAAGIDLMLGLRVGDFDNDYRAVVGIEGTGGSLLDASSNYPLMMGPLVALAGTMKRGRHSVEGYLGQSVLLGSAELDGMSREFTGPFGPSPALVAIETFQQKPDVAIPITEFRLRYRYRLGDRVSLGAGVETSVWRDVPVPPGVTPIADGDEALHENTIVFFGLLGGLTFTF
jgi:hypothetical protein